MTNEELKETMLAGEPVLLCDPRLGNIEYKRVLAVRYWAKDGKIKVSAELEDKHGHSITVARPRYLKAKEEADENVSKMERADKL